MDIAGFWPTAQTRAVCREEFVGRSAVFDRCSQVLSIFIATGVMKLISFGCCLGYVSLCFANCNLSWQAEKRSLSQERCSSAIKYIALSSFQTQTKYCSDQRTLVLPQQLCGLTHNVSSHKAKIKKRRKSTPKFDPNRMD